MPRPIWKGGISVGLVNIPVSLYPACEASEEISFRQLHRKDLAPIQSRRVCSAEGTEVPWGEIVKGYEFAKGEFVVMSDEDLAKARVEATQAVDIRDFVPRQLVPPRSTQPLEPRTEQVTSPDRLWPAEVRDLVVPSSLCV